MRFSETLRFNANPDWWLYYIPYDELKVQVAELRELHNAVFFSAASAQRAQGPSQEPHADDSTDDEADVEAPSPRTEDLPSMRRTASSRVLADMRKRSGGGYHAVLEGLPSVPISLGLHREPGDGSVADARRRFEEHDSQFFDKLDKHATAVDEFFKCLVIELRKIATDLQRDGESVAAKMATFSAGDRVEHTPLLNASAPSSPEYSENRDTIEAELQAIRTRVIEHYKELGETINFSNLNKTGFDKILKKHDKYTNRTSRASFMANLLSTTEFADTTELETLKTQTERMYADVFKRGDVRAGRDELRDELRDLIVWDRNTIWRDVLRTERKVSAFHSVKGGERVSLDGIGDVTVRLRMLPSAAAIAAFVIILCFPGIIKSLVVDDTAHYTPETLAAAHRCLALVVFVVILWASEGVPLYVASFTVFPGVILLRVFLDKEHNPLGPQDASKAVFAKMSSPTLLLIVCVYTLGAALSKFEVDKLAATLILSRLRKPGSLLCALMFMAVFVSIFVSNVAAPVLLNSVMMPTIDAMGHSEANRAYVRCLLLGIMIGSNIGGFASPISSPQSAVALGLLNDEHKISFAMWLMAAIPVCAVMVLTCFSALYLWYKPQRFALPPLPRFSELLGWRHWVVIGTLVLTVLIWSVHALQDVFGSAGVVAVIPIIVFFGSGILKKEDFNNLPWDVVYLVAGGIVLGAAVESCKLLDLVAAALTKSFEGNVVKTYAVFCFFMAVIANAVSHTVSSIIVLPLIYQIGVELQHPQLLVLGGTFAASSAMALPISSFPNISATQVEDEKGVQYLSTSEVLRVGSVMTLLSTIVLLTFGYVLMSWMLD